MIHTVLTLSSMKELALLPPAAASDLPLVSLWLSTKTSPETRRAYGAEVSRFAQFTGKPLGAVTLADLQAYAAGLGQGSLKPASQNRALTAVKSLLSFAHETGYLPFNVGAPLKLRPVRNDLARRILDEATIAKLLDAASTARDRLMLKLLYVSGARVGEICRLTWADAQARPEGGQITVFGKGGKTRAILLKPAVWEQLLQFRAAAPDTAPIFPSRKGGALDASQVRRIVYAAAQRAGLSQKVSPHWMRHAHASHALDRNAPIHLVQATLGHASVSTTGRYLHARPNESSGLYLPD
jgi:site-specific recombinase XerD